MTTVLDREALEKKAYSLGIRGVLSGMREETLLAKIKEKEAVQKDKFIDDLESAEQTFEEAVEAEMEEEKEFVKITDIKKVPKGEKFPDGELFGEQTVWKVFNVKLKKLCFMNGAGVDSLLSNRDDIRKQLWKGEISQCSIQNMNADTTYRIRFEYYEDYSE